ncbi:DUF269 domain-containing protein [Mesorhizobium atlanticum]|uniref:DUF269 domain-containing protein n=1 Tax=Mesorhizobium atlanticum TaxID=2233532 RepID=A0A330GGX0_9HYPH|nr:DUF269 domain-containing protein [Mesorhizobium atlanticum]RAZ71733.1 hypothetical protein DPM35_29590 [Mesorhizobium atlanticum]
MNCVTPISPTVDEDELALAAPFVKCLVRLIRAQEPCHLWEDKSDAMLLADFIVTTQKRRAIPGEGYPDPHALWKIDMFYSAVGLAIAEHFGKVKSPIMGAKPSTPLGAGFSVPSVGPFFPEIHRFGFESLRQLAEAGTRLVDVATTDIEAPEETMAK